MHKIFYFLIQLSFDIFTALENIYAYTVLAFSICVYFTFQNIVVILKIKYNTCNTYVCLSLKICIVFSKIIIDL